jgi:NADH:ubiquinone oxidoreductase subunit C
VNINILQIFSFLTQDWYVKFNIRDLKKNFYFFLLNLQFNLAVLKNFNKSIPSIASLYKIAQWSEREVGEMHGVVFKRKLDNRRLLLDYSFVGYPLLKSFAIMGYVELCFNFTLSWLYYLSLKLRDGGEHIIYFA